MAKDFISNKRYECVRCKRKTTPRYGVLTSYGEQFPPDSFLCLQCIRALDKIEEAKRQDEWKAIAKPPCSLAPNDEETMLSLLTDLYPEPGWYTIHSITEAFNAKRYSITSKRVSRILNKLGYKRRKRLTRKKITFAYVELGRRLNGEKAKKS